MIKNYLFGLFVIGTLCSSNINCIGHNSQHICLNPSKYGFINRPHSNEHYYVSDIQVNWIEGELLCRSFGAHLPSVMNHDDNEYLRNLFGKLLRYQHRIVKGDGFSGYWLGGFLSVPERQWKWIDGNPFLYTNWDYVKGQPNNLKDVEKFISDNYDMRKNKFIDWHDFMKNEDKIVICKLEC